MSTSTRRVDGTPETAADTRFFDLRESGYRGPIDHNGRTVSPTVMIDAAALSGMLANLMLSAGRATGLPTLNGVALHTATDAAGEPVLVGTSTDRFMLGQAHEPIGSGSVPLTFLRLAAVRTLLAALDGPDDPDGDDTEPGPAVLSVAGNTVTVAYAGQSVQVAASSDWYPTRVVPRVLTDAEAVNRPAYVAGSYLGVLAAIADRRDGSVVLTVQQPDRPVHAHIGQRYRALIMPIKQDNAPPVPPAFLPPSADREAVA